MAKKQDPKDNNQLKGINFNTLLYINIDDRQGCRNCIALIFSKVLVIVLEEEEKKMITMASFEGRPLVENARCAISCANNSP